MSASKGESIDELRRQYDRLVRALPLFRELVSSTELEVLHRRLVQGVVDEFAPHTAYLGRLRPVRDCLEVLVALGKGGAQLPADLSLSHPLVSAVVASESAQVRAGRKDSQRNAAGFLTQQGRSLLAVKFHLEGDETDVLVLESEQDAAFNDGDAEFLLGLVQTLETVLLNRYSLSRSDREIELLLDVTAEKSAVARTLDESERSLLLQKILQLALSRTRCRHGSVLLLQEETGDLRIEAETFSLDYDQKVPTLLKRRSGRPSGVVFRVVDENRLYLANDTDGDPYYTPLLGGTRASLAVPMSFQGRCIGVILVESQVAGYFTEEHQQLMTALASTATSFVRRAQLHASMLGAKGRDDVFIKGRGPAWEEVDRRVERAAATDATVCLRGESGTGKELVAHAIHFNSQRAKLPLVTVNCAAIPGELLESELFGHVRGAFTGAVTDRPGRFEVADGGTLFLDEIGDLPPALQVKLLRVLQSGEIRKVGSDQSRTVDIRIVAATSRNLEEMVGRSLFREDLYYRLMVVPILLPPLREYPDSIPGMAKQFVRDANVRYGRSVIGLSEESLAALHRHSFPGNVRELRNIVERAVLMTDESYVLPGDLPGYLRGEGPPPPMPGSLRDSSPVAAMPRAQDHGSGESAADLRAGDASRFLASGEDFKDWDYKGLKADLVERFEARYLDALLAATEGNVTRAAALAGIHRVNLHRMLRKRQDN